MTKKLFITGTGTDIGKSYVTGLIVKKLHDAGLKAAYYKAAMSGNDKAADGSLIPGDALRVKTMSGIKQPLEEMCPYVYEVAVSPHLASKVEDNSIELQTVVDGFKKVAAKYDYITMEGSGGIICPLRYDDKVKMQLEDVIKACDDAACLMIADAGLGTINGVVLTAFYMKEHHIPLRGIIFNNFEKGNFLHEDNVKMCEELTGLKVLACVEHGATDLDIDVNVLKELYV